MTTKITIIYDNPTDVDAFERGFADTKQLELAAALPGLERLESSKVWPKEDGTAPPAHRLIDLYFADYDTASAAVATPEAGALFPTIFGIASGGVRIVFAEVEQG
jgi:uncharacterized protein (TIGR02118 family)